MKHFNLACKTIAPSGCVPYLLELNNDQKDLLVVAYLFGTQMHYAARKYYELSQEFKNVVYSDYEQRLLSAIEDYNNGVIEYEKERADDGFIYRSIDSDMIERGPKCA